MDRNISGSKLHYRGRAILQELRTLSLCVMFVWVSKQVSPEKSTYKTQYNCELCLNVDEFENKCLYLEARI